MRIFTFTNQIYTKNAMQFSTFLCLSMNKSLYRLAMLLIFSIASATFSFAGGFIQKDTALVKAANCDAKGAFCLDHIVLSNVAAYNIKTNNAAYAGSVKGCKVDTAWNFSYADVFLQGASGGFTIDSFAVNNKLYLGRKFAKIADLVDSLNKWDYKGNWKLNNTTKNIRGGNVNHSYRAKFTITSIQASSKTPIVLNGEKADGIELALSTGVYIITALQPGSTKLDTVYVTIACDTPTKNCKDLIKPDVVWGQTANCDLEGEVCIPKLALEDALELKIFGDGVPYTGVRAGCDYDTLHTYDYSILFGGGAIPPYNIDAWYINGQKFTGMFQTIPELVDSMNKWDTHGLWVLDANLKKINNETAGSVDYTDIMVTQPTFLAQSMIGYNYGLNAMGTRLYFKKGTHTVVFNRPSDGCTDTLKATIVCVSPSTAIKNIKVNASDTTCIDFGQLTGPATSVTIVSGNNTGSVVTYSLSADKKCIYGKGNKVGKDTAIVVYCDANKICDTLYLVINVTDGVPVPTTKHLYTETIKIGQNSQHCIPTTALTAPLTPLVNLCPQFSGKNVTFTPNSTTNCIEYKGLSVGVDTACYVVCGAGNKCDTTIFLITVEKGIVPSSTQHLHQATIKVGQTGSHCITVSNLAKPLKPLVNFCPQFGGKNAKFTPDNNTYCVDYKGLTPGVDTACYVVCDANNKCDTTIFLITVEKDGVIPSQPSIVRDTVYQGNELTYCVTAAQAKKIKTGKITATNSCNKLNGKVAFSFNTNDPTCKPPAGLGVSVKYKGLKVGTDTACVVFTDSLGTKDTVQFVIHVLKRSPNQFIDSVIVNNKGAHCFNFKDFDLETNVDSLKLCSGLGTHIVLLPTTVGLCPGGVSIGYQGVKVGTDTICILVKDTKGNYDTVQAIVKVLKPKVQPSIVKDTILINFTHTYCVDTATLELLGKLDTAYNYCAKKTGSPVVFTINKNSPCTTVNGTPGLSIVYTGGEIGKDTACFVFKDKLGNADTVRFFVTVVPPKKAVIFDTVQIGKTLDICLSTKELGGTVTNITNLCPKSSGTNAKFTFLKNNPCFKADGLVVGVDTACLIMCDDFDVCDTTTVYITVIPKKIPTEKPISIDDIATVKADSLLKIPVIVNDNLKGDTLTSLIVLPILNGGAGPNHGKAEPNRKDGTIVYTPTAGFCGKDTLTYVICTAKGCDTSLVTITVVCDTTGNNGPFKIFEGFSPNGDGINENFVIKGLENLKDNELFVYNRWGNQVYHKKNYDNTWNGKWEGSDLPDGTYFIIFNATFNDNTTKKIACPVTIMR
jgi:gliding motility-associated-like protein